MLKLTADQVEYRKNN